MSTTEITNTASNHKIYELLIQHNMKPQMNMRSDLKVISNN